MAPTAESYGKFSYLKSGNGKLPVIFLHGNACSKKAFFQILEKDFPDATLYALDLPGFGENAGKNQVFSFKNTIQYLEDFIREKGIGHFILAGHSMGGNIAIHYSKKHPEQVKHLILIAPAGFESFSEKEKLVLKSNFQKFPPMSLLQSIQFLIPTGFYRKENPDLLKLISKIYEDFMAATSSEYLQLCNNGMEEMLNHEPFHAKNFPAVKTSVLFGDQDPLIPNRLFHPEAPREFVLRSLKGIPQLKLFLFENCGHYVQGEAPEKTAALLKQIIAANL